MSIVRGRLRRVGLGVLLAALGVGESLGAATQAAGESLGPQRRVALVVGNARYTELPILVNSKNDASDMCAVLGQLGFETLCIKDIPTRREFKQHLQGFRAKLGPGVAALFYYAGHGIQLEGENYLIPTTATLRHRDDVEDETLSMRSVMSALEDGKSDFNFIILDACRNRPPTGGFARSLGRGLAPVTDAPAGALVLYATAANERASDGARGERNSPFAKHLLAHMRQPGLTVEALIKRVSVAVQEDTLRTDKRRQVPFSYGSFTGEFCFAGCTVPSHSAEIAQLQREKDALKQRQAELAQREAQINQQPTPASAAAGPRSVQVPPAF